MVLIKVGMTVTYKPMKMFPEIQTPVLHRVVYAHTVDYVDAFYQRSYKDHLVDAWLKENCQGNYYHSPGYLREKFIEFEDECDAIFFTLRWS
jgi:hypothetical protein